MAARLVLLSFCILAASARQFRSQQQLGSDRNFLPRPFVNILRMDSAGPKPDGSYAFSFEDSAGAKREEVSQATGPNSFAVQGAYSYTNEDGSLVEVRYVANENGFQVESPFLPKAPPMPPHAVEQMRMAEDMKRQGIVFDERGFIVGHRRGSQVGFKQESSSSQSIFQRGF